MQTNKSKKTLYNFSFGELIAFLMGVKFYSLEDLKEFQSKDEIIDLISFYGWERECFKYLA